MTLNYILLLYVCTTTIIHIGDFIHHVVEYYSSMCDYIRAKLPLKKHAEGLDVSLRQSVGLDSVMYFVNLHPVLCDKDAVDQLQSEFSHYQVFPFQKDLLEIPSLDEQWTKILDLKDESGNHRFQLLGKVVLGIMVLPHSNVDCEHVFSLVTKNLTKFRPSMSAKTLQSLLVLKCSSSVFGKAHKVVLDRKLLLKCKRATVESLKSS